MLLIVFLYRCIALISKLWKGIYVNHFYVGISEINFHEELMFCIPRGGCEKIASSDTYIFIF